jgi:hypothetical protein
MARRQVYLLIFSMPSPRLELRTLADYTSLISSYSISLDIQVLGNMTFLQSYSQINSPSYRAEKGTATNTQVD